MSADHRNALGYLQQIFQESTLEELLPRLAAKSSEITPTMPKALSLDAIESRWDLLSADSETKKHILDSESLQNADHYRHNIENYIGTAKIPIGLVGPLRVNGLFAQGDYYVPLATTEAALVASYCRGSRLVTESGGCTALLLNEGVGRAPGFAFASLIEVGQFVLWVTGQLEQFRRCAEATTNHGKLKDMRITIEGNHVYLNFEFTTGDAAGQNMVTLATEAICEYIDENTPIKPQYGFVEANLSGDKKASLQSFLSVRGKKVSAEVVVPSDLIKKRLHTNPEHMVNYWRMSALGGVLSGTMGVQGHYANGLAALYIACGQDAACVAESAVGVTRFEVTADGDLYASVTLPNVMVGTVGGGTGLPSQQACLKILRLAGKNKARALAEVAVALCLAGELSIIGALCSGDFSRAHRLFARGKARKQHEEKNDTQ